MQLEVLWESLSHSLKQMLEVIPGRSRSTGVLCVIVRHTGNIHERAPAVSGPAQCAGPSPQRCACTH
jgi:hypothetical protein